MIYETDPQVTTEQINDILYPQINNDIEYGLFENVIDSYYLDSQIRDDFTCTKACYTHNTTVSTPDTNPQCTHTHDHISQQLDSIAEAEQQQTLYTNKADASLFTTYPMREEQKKVIQKEMDRLEQLGFIRKGLTSDSSPVVQVKRKNQNLYRVCSDFWILNEKLLKINHAFPLV